MKPHPLLDLLGSQTPPPIKAGRVVKKLGARSEANSSLGPPMPKTQREPTLTERVYALLLERPYRRDELAAALRCAKNSLCNPIIKLTRQGLLTRTGNNRAGSVMYHAVKPTKQRTAK